VIQTEMYQVQPSDVKGLSDDEVEKFNELLRIWQDKATNNRIQTEFYEQRNKFIDLGIAIPPSMRNINAAIGWASMAVDCLAERSIFDGFTFRGKRRDDISDILEANNSKELYSEACTTELIHSCSFLTVSRGDENEPPVVLNAYSALEGAVVWDRRNKRPKYGFAVTDTTVPDSTGRVEPTEVNLYLDYATVVCRRLNNTWYAEHLTHSQGRPLFEVLRNEPSLMRPMGKSRISPAVMAYTNSAMRCAVRGELSSELFASPQKYLLGADDGVFGEQEDEDDDEVTKMRKRAARERSKMQAYLGTIFAVTPNSNGDIPQFGQLSQMSMEPHNSYMYMLAKMFSGETCIPVSRLGVMAESNPTSFEAIQAMNEPLILKAQRLNETNGNTLKNVGRLMLAIMGNKTLADLTDDERRLSVSWADPSRPSTAAQTDAATKLASIFPYFTESDVALEMVGFSEEQIARLNEAKSEYEKKQEEAKAKLEEQMNPDAGEEDSSQEEEAQTDEASTE